MHPQRLDGDSDAAGLDFTQTSQAALTEADSLKSGPDFQEDTIPLLQLMGFC